MVIGGRHESGIRRIPLLVVAFLANALPVFLVPPDVASADANKTPTIGTASETVSGTASVTWTAPATLTGLVGYLVVPKVGASEQTALSKSVPSVATTVNVTGLTDGTSYTFVVKSVYSDGTTFSSGSSNAVTPYGLPGKPTNVAGVAGDGTIDVTWGAAAENGRAITQYLISVAPADIPSVTVSASTLSTTLTGLTNGRPYKVTVRATNLRGDTDSDATADVTPVGKPSAPTNVSAVGGDGQATVTWTIAQNTGGKNLTGFVVIAIKSDGTETTTSATPAATSKVFSGLTNGSSYTFVLTATNEGGLTSDRSLASSNVVPAGGGSAPTLNDDGSVSPKSGLVAGGYDLEITGQNLSAVTSVSFACTGGNQTGTVKSTTQTLVIVTAPACAAGAVTITVTNSSGSDTTNYFFRELPTLTSINPATGVALGGGSVLLTGTNFVTGSATTVTIGGKSATVVSMSTTTISATVPTLSGADTVGAKDVVVTIDNVDALKATLVGGYTYTKNSNSVTINDPGAKTFGAAGTSSFAIVASNTRGTTMSYSAVGTPGGICSFANAAVSTLTVTGAGSCEVTVTAAESSLHSLATNSATVTINKGTPTLTFAPPARVTLTSNPRLLALNATANSGGSIAYQVTSGTCTIVDGATLSATALGTCSVAATVSATANYNESSTSPQDIQIVANPDATSISRAFVAANGGTAFTISGTALGGSNSSATVTFVCSNGDRNATSVSVHADGTTISATSPTNCAAGGPIDVKVTTNDGLDTLTNAVTVLATPTLTAADPAVGPLAGGTSVTLSGTGFVSGHTTVSIGGIAVSEVTVSSSTQILITTPAGASYGSKSVTVVVGEVVQVSSSVFAYKEAPSTPSAPTVSASDGAASITWAAPAANGGTIDYYVVEMATGSALSDPFTNWTVITSGSSQTTTTLNKSGLTNGTYYKFRVKAHNEVGFSSFSPSSTAVKPAKAAAAPTDLAATVKSPTNGLQDAEVLLNWSEPTDSGGNPITGYKIEKSPNGSSGWETVIADTASSATSVTVSAGLTAGTIVHFRVRAITEVGDGAASSSISVTPIGVPAKPDPVPTGVLKLPSNNVASGAVRVSWTAPATNGSAILFYVVQSAEGPGFNSWSNINTSPSTSATTLDYTGLTNGTAYKFKVTAVNAAGVGAESDPSTSLTPRGVPAQVAQPTVAVKLSTNAVGSGEVLVTWDVPDTNGSAITDYVIERATGPGFTDWTTVSDSVSAATTSAVTGLTNGTQYRFRVSAVNAAGTGTASAESATAIPRNVPAAVAAPTVTVRTSSSSSVLGQEALLSWSAPADNGAAITDYVIQYATGSAYSSWVTFVDGVTTAATTTVTGLSNGFFYKFRVTAKNAAGDGTTGVESAAARPVDVPGAPTAVVAVDGVGDGEMIVRWTAPANRGGLPISGYSVTSTPGSKTCTTTGATSCVVSELANGTSYTFVVKATNAVGDSGNSGASAGVIPFGVPAAPLAPTVSATSGTVTVELVAPANDNGSTVSALTATASPSGATCSGAPGTSCNITGLVNGTSYTVRVKAANAAGFSEESPTSSAVTPVGVPSAPFDVIGIPGDTAVTVYWDPPRSLNGAAISDYIIQVTGSAINDWTTFNDGVTTAATATVTGLTNGGSYTFRVRAVNSAGDSAWSAAMSDAVTPLAPLSNTEKSAIETDAATDTLVNLDPTAGSEVSVSATGFAPTTTVRLTLFKTGWTAPLVIGSAVTNVSGSAIVKGPLPPTVTAGTYKLSVIGEGVSLTGELVAMVAPLLVQSDEVVVQAPTVPGKPTSVTPALGNLAGSITVTWNAPSDGGAPITKYTVTSSPGGKTCVSEIAGSGNCTVTGLTVGTSYTFTIKATNSVGDSEASDASASIAAPGAPGAPTSVTSEAVLGASGQAKITWVASAANGGTGLVYQVQSVEDPSKVCPATPGNVLECTISGLTAYTPYTFKVTVLSTIFGVSQSATSTPTSPLALVSVLPASPKVQAGVTSGTPTSSTPTSGSQITVTVADGTFDAFEWVSVVLESNPTVLKILQASANGGLSTTATLPTGVTGSHDLTVITDERTDGSYKGVTQALTIGGGGNNNQNNNNQNNNNQGGGGGGGKSNLPVPSRVSGADRFSTAAALSASRFAPDVPVVYIATGANYADALAAGPAANNQGPVLLSELGTLPKSTIDELTRLKPKRIVILGGTAAINATVETSLRWFTTGSITRIGGADRYATAAQLSAATFRTGVSVVYVATGTNFADALSAGAAAQGRGPVLLVANASIPAATATELSRLQPGRIVVLGGPAAVAESVRTALAAYTTGSVTRIGGDDRYATAAFLSEASFAVGVDKVYLATGLNFADALSAGPLGVPVLLVRKDCVPQLILNEINRLQPTSIVVLGGTEAVSSAVVSLTACP